MVAGFTGRRLGAEYESVFSNITTADE